MRHRLVFIVCSISMTFINSVFCFTTTPYPDPEEQVIRKAIRECTESQSRITCFSEKAAVAIERAMEWDVPLFDGIHFARNDEKAVLSQGRALGSGFGRLTTAVSNFLDTHTVKLDLTETPRGRGEGGGGASSVVHEGHGHKEVKKEKKYMQYAFMVLLGIFGLTGPLVMKTLAIIAAKALIASKVALIIVGSVALKKIFEKDHEHSAVKVHTISDDDHDRLFNMGYYNQPYSAYDGWSKPA